MKKSRIKIETIATWIDEHIIYYTIGTLIRLYDKGMARLEKSPRWCVIPRFVDLSGKHRVSSLAAEIAFYLLLAIFPFIIFVISLIGFVGRTSFLSPTSLDQLQELFPAPVYLLLHGFLDTIVTGKSLTLLSFSMLGIIWSASSGFSVLLNGLLRIHGRIQWLNLLQMRSLGLIMTLFLVLALVISMVLITFGGLLLSQLAALTGLPALAGPMLAFTRYLAAFIILSLFFTLLYFLVARRPIRVIRILPGAIFSSSAWLLLSQGFSWYVAEFDRYTIVYGGLAGMIILMLWLYFCSMVMLTGGIVNVLLRDLHNKETAPDVILE